MLTPEEIEELVVMPKRVVYENDNGLLSEISIRTEAPIQYRITMKPVNRENWKFLWNINQSKKNIFKLTLFLMETTGLTELLRIDYAGRHKQPETINEYVPKDLVSTAGTWLESNQPHIHINIKGFEPQAWARPIGNNFAVKEIINQKNVLDAILAFRNIINLETRILFENPLMP